jgi:ankyrin repeat protein
MEDKENGPKIIKKMADDILHLSDPTMLIYFFSALRGIDLSLIDLHNVLAMLIVRNFRKTINVLHDIGYNFNRNNNAKTALLDIAIKTRHLEIVQDLISYGVKLAVKSNNDTSLSCACYRGTTIEIFEELLKLESTAEQRKFAMCSAIEVGNVAFLKLLIEKTEYVPATAFNDPLYHAIIKDDLEMAKIILEWQKHQLYKDQCAVAVQYARMDILKMFLENSPSLVNCAIQKGFTPLHLACLHNKIEVVHFLLEHGTRTDIASHEGFIPIFYAMAYGRHEIVELLESHKK